MHVQIEVAPPGHRDPARGHLHDAMRLLIGSDIAAMRNAIGGNVSVSTIEKWRLPFGSWNENGVRSPAHRLDQLIDCALDLGRPLADAMAPVTMLAELRGFGLHVLGGLEGGDMHDATADVVGTSGQFSSRLLRAIADGRLDLDERTDLRQLRIDLRRALTQLDLILRLEPATN